MAQKIVSMLLLFALLPGCATHPGLFAEVDGNIQHRTGASDWALTDGYGKDRYYIGQVKAVVGVEYKGFSGYAGFNHLSMPEYGHDRGFNGQVIGLSYRHYF